MASGVIAGSGFHSTQQQTLAETSTNVLITYVQLLISARTQSEVTIAFKKCHVAMDIHSVKKHRNVKVNLSFIAAK